MHGTLHQGQLLQFFLEPGIWSPSHPAHPGLHVSACPGSGPRNDQTSMESMSSDRGGQGGQPS